MQCSSQLAWLQNKGKNMLRKKKGPSKFLERAVTTQNTFVLMKIKKIMVHFPENLEIEVH